MHGRSDLQKRGLAHHPGGRARPPIALVGALLCAASACGSPGEDPEALAQRALDPRPNVLWIVWDTVRADRMSLYGYERKTTPVLEEWAKGALVFEDARSAAGYTVPSHASMFTGRLPSEHCAHNSNPTLAPGYTTVAELLSRDGYSTYAFSANPHISTRTGLAQGFERVEHPWSERFRDRARRINEERVREDSATELGERLKSGANDWSLKAAGVLAETALDEFLDGRDAAKPWFAFVNYMEAHRPALPARRFREAFLNPEEIEASTRVDRSWNKLWSYTFGLSELDPRELELLGAVYDAAILELDTMLGELLSRLEARGALENTVVVLTADHGEHLGEHHMLDHQYSLYEPLLRVPLLIHAPGRIEAGRSRRPVATPDLFPTLLELAGSEAPATGSRHVQSLLAPASDSGPGAGTRSRLAEEPGIQEVGVRVARSLHPGFSGREYLRRLRALTGPRFKFIWSSNGDHELYDLDRDPRELDDLRARREFTVTEMQAQLDALDRSLLPCADAATAGAPDEPSAEERRMLEALGYAEES